MKNVSSNGDITEQKCDIIPLQVFTGQDFIINNELYILPCATLYRRDILIKIIYRDILIKIIYRDILIKIIYSSAREYFTKM